MDSSDRTPSSPSGSGRSGGSSGRSGGGSGRSDHSGRRAGRTRAGQYVCVFWLGGQRYALDAVLVGEVISVPSLLPVPLTPSWVLGLCNLRGVALAVVDLAQVLGLKPASGAAAEANPLAAGAGMPVLVLRSDRVAAGIRIDRIEAVYPFETARFEGAAVLEEHPAVKGILTFETRGGFVATLLDEERVAKRLRELRFKKADAGARALPAND